MARITIKKYDFKETLTDVYITVGIIGITAAKADIYSNSLLLKINSPPFLFTLDLFEPVERESSAQISNNTVTITLTKKIPGLWGKASFKSDDKREILERRQEAEDEYIAEIESDRVRRNLERNDNERALVTRQIEVERAERARLDEYQRAEKDLAEAALMDWTHESSDKAQQGDFDEQYIELEESMHSTSALQESIPKLENEVSERLPDLTFDDLDLDESELDMDLIMQKVELQIHGKPVKILPPPRSFQIIEFKFTDRGLLPTTVARESEDAKWHVRIREAKELAAKKPILNDDHEQDQTSGKISHFVIPTVISLKIKAKELIAQENFEGAINAYTAILATDRTDITMLSNRSTCYLRLADYKSCIDDCTEGLVLNEAQESAIIDGVAAGEGQDTTLVKRQQQRCKLLVRRGSARVWSGKMQEFESGVVDYRDAVKLCPSNDLIFDLNGLEQRLVEMKNIAPSD